MAGNFLFDANMSPAGFRSRLALRLAGIEYVRVSMDLALFDQKTALYRQMNPTGLVPTLILGDAILFDSHAIVERVLKASPAETLLDYRCGHLIPPALENLERVISQLMRPAVYALVAPQRLKSRFANWEEARKTLKSRGVPRRYLEFAYNLFHERPDVHVVEAVIGELEPLLEAIRPAVESSGEAVAQNRMDYFALCLAPRLNSVRLLGLDPGNILGRYLDLLSGNPLWAEVAGQGYDMDFTEYKENC